MILNMVHVVETFAEVKKRKISEEICVENKSTSINQMTANRTSALIKDLLIMHFTF